MAVPLTAMIIDLLEQFPSVKCLTSSVVLHFTLPLASPDIASPTPWTGLYLVMSDSEHLNLRLSISSAYNTRVMIWSFEDSRLWRWWPVMHQTCKTRHLSRAFRSRIFHQMPMQVGVAHRKYSSLVIMYIHRHRLCAVNLTPCTLAAYHQIAVYVIACIFTLRKSIPPIIREPFRDCDVNYYCTRTFYYS